MRLSLNIDASGKRGTWIAAGFMTAFGLAFATLGVYAWHQESAKDPESWVPLLGGAAFVVFGLGIVALAVGSLRLLYRQKAEREGRADRPWLWREEWASGRLSSGGLSIAAARSVNGANVAAVLPRNFIACEKRVRLSYPRQT